MTRKHFIKILVGLNHRIHAEGLAKGSVRNINYNTLNEKLPPLLELQKHPPFIKDWSDFLKMLYDAVGINSMDDLM